jgi:CRP-like cAMP-binding protein
MHAIAENKPAYKVLYMSQAERPNGTQKFEVNCSGCNLRELCLPGGVAAEDHGRLENIVYARRRVKRGESVFSAGDEFRAIYAVRSGFFKSSLNDGEGREQVTGFFMGGELMGLEGIGRAATAATRSRSRTARSACCPSAWSRRWRARFPPCSATCTRCSRARSCATTA